MQGLGGRFSQVGDFHQQAASGAAGDYSNDCRHYGDRFGFPSPCHDITLYIFSVHGIWGKFSTGLNESYSGIEQGLFLKCYRIYTAEHSKHTNNNDA